MSRALKFHRALVRFHNADDHVEGGRLARAVRAEQPDDFTRAHVHRNAVHHAAAMILLHQFFRGEQQAVRLVARSFHWHFSLIRDWIEFRSRKIHFKIILARPVGLCCRRRIGACRRAVEILAEDHFRISRNVQMIVARGPKQSHRR